MIAAGKTSFRVVSHWDSFSQIEGVFSSAFEAKQCISSLENEENESSFSDYCGSVLQEINSDEEILSSERFDF
jgi:hypothetical protein